MPWVTAVSDIALQNRDRRSNGSAARTCRRWCCSLKHGYSVDRYEVLLLPGSHHATKRGGVVPAMPFYLGAVRASGDDFQGAVIIAMSIVGMVQSAVHEIADMASVRDSLVPASGAMDMVWLVTETVFGHGRAVFRVLVGHFDDMLVHMIFMGMVKMAIVKIIDMITMANGRMAATGAVDMRMVLVLRIRASHRCSP